MFSLGGAAINRGLVMVWAGPGLVFVVLVRLGSLCQHCLKMLRYGIFFNDWE